MDGITEFARLLKERENKEFMGIQTGKIITSFPNIKIRLGEKIILNESNLIISETIYNKTLTEGIEVILIPTSDNQRFYLIDKVVEI